MRSGMATDHGGYGLKDALLPPLRAAGQEVIDVGAHHLDPSDDAPDVGSPLARAVAAGEVARGVVIGGSCVDAAVCATQVPGIRAAIMHNHGSARQGVEDAHMQRLCRGGRTVGLAVA